MTNYRFHREKFAEVMQQNLLQLEEILALRAPEDEAAVATNHATETFRPQKEFKIGQWLDVRDTVGEWLEAQVVSSEVDRVRVHYNDWGARWDEWIPISSGRLASFRTHTVQSPNAPFFSPFPASVPDGGVSLPPHGSSFDSLLRRFSTFDYH